MQSASATSLNFVGFEDMKGYGTPPLHFGQIYIEPNLPSRNSSDVCTPCPQPGSDCRANGTTLDSMPLKPGFADRTEGEHR